MTEGQIPDLLAALERSINDAMAARRRHPRPAAVTEDDCTCTGDGCDAEGDPGASSSTSACPS